MRADPPRPCPMLPESLHGLGFGLFRTQEVPGLDLLAGVTTDITALLGAFSQQGGSLPTFTPSAPSGQTPYPHA